jgi:molybdopterin/thiamine biosynthesis adenylyltransferase
MHIPTRFSRNIGILSDEEQSCLLASTVAVVGMGCTGCAATEFLARVGVGGFILIDGDTFDETNLNRQLYARVSTLGQCKAIAATAAVMDVNPDARVIAHPCFLAESNAEKLLTGADIVINGLDDPFTMVVLHRTARHMNIPSVFLLSGCVPFQGVCTTFPADSPVDYESVMGLPTRGSPLESPEVIRAELFKKITSARVHSALRRGALPGPWVERRLGGGWMPSFGATSNIVAIVAATEAVKMLIHRKSLPPVRAPELIVFDGAACSMTIAKPPEGSSWFQGNF